MTLVLGTFLANGVMVESVDLTHKSEQTRKAHTSPVQKRRKKETHNNHHTTPPAEEQEQEDKEQEDKDNKENGHGEAQNMKKANNNHVNNNNNNHHNNNTNNNNNNNSNNNNNNNSNHNGKGKPLRKISHKKGANKFKKQHNNNSEDDSDDSDEEESTARDLKDRKYLEALERAGNVEARERIEQARVNRSFFNRKKKAEEKEYLAVMQALCEANLWDPPPLPTGFSLSDCEEMEPLYPAVEVPGFTIVTPYVPYNTSYSRLFYDNYKQGYIQMYEDEHEVVAEENGRVKETPEKVPFHRKISDIFGSDWSKEEINMFEELLHINGPRFDDISGLMCGSKDAYQIQTYYSEKWASSTDPQDTKRRSRCHLCFEEGIEEGASTPKGLHKRGPKSRNGKLIVCGGCERAYHYNCLTPRPPANGDAWFCSEECSSMSNLQCQLCGNAENDDQMLLCDSCDRGYHIFCLTPPLAAIPEGDWNCPQCTRGPTTKSSITSASPAFPTNTTSKHNSAANVCTHPTYTFITAIRNGGNPRAFKVPNTAFLEVTSSQTLPVPASPTTPKASKIPKTESPEKEDVASTQETTASNLDSSCEIIPPPPPPPTRTINTRNKSKGSVSPSPSPSPKMTPKSKPKPKLPSPTQPAAVAVLASPPSPAIPALKLSPSLAVSQDEFPEEEVDEQFDSAKIAASASPHSLLAIKHWGKNVCIECLLQRGLLPGDAIFNRRSFGKSFDMRDDNDEYQSIFAVPLVSIKFNYKTALLTKRLDAILAAVIIATQTVLDGKCDSNNHAHAVPPNNNPIVVVKKKRPASQPETPAPKQARLEVPTTPTLAPIPTPVLTTPLTTPILAPGLMASPIPITLTSPVHGAMAAILSPVLSAPATPVTMSSPNPMTPPAAMTSPVMTPPAALAASAGATQDYASGQWWIFTFNPRVRDVATLIPQALFDWQVRQHADKIKTGDRVYVWVSGKKPGIYAIGTITRDPFCGLPEDGALSPTAGVAERTCVRLDESLSSMVAKDLLEKDPLLKALPVVRCHPSTCIQMNYLVNPRHVEKLATLIASRTAANGSPASLSPTASPSLTLWSDGASPTPTSPIPTSPTPTSPPQILNNVNSTSPTLLSPPAKATPVKLQPSKNVLKPSPASPAPPSPYLSPLLALRNPLLSPTNHPPFQFNTPVPPSILFPLLSPTLTLSPATPVNPALLFAAITAPMTMVNPIIPTLPVPTARACDSCKRADVSVTLQCVGCKDWYHPGCTSAPTGTMALLPWYCPPCATLNQRGHSCASCSLSFSLGSTQNNPSPMVVCDWCSQGYHSTCVVPSIATAQVPRCWICAGCRITQDERTNALLSIGWRELRAECFRIMVGECEYAYEAHRKCVAMYSKTPTRVYARMRELTHSLAELRQFVVALAQKRYAVWAKTLIPSLTKPL